MDTTYPADLAFTRPTEAEACPVRPGLKRVKPRARGVAEAFDFHQCHVTDMVDGDFLPDLFDHGFDTTELTGFDKLQRTLESCRQEAHIEDEDAAVIRSTFEGATLTLASGRSLTVQFVSPDGLVMRKAGPNGHKVCGPMTTMNDHGAATSIHADQDVLGTPLVQVMGGRAPDLFRHHAPDSRNDDGDLLLLNVWIPLDAITRPLVLADSNTLDRRQHQLRYGLQVDEFLDRDEDQQINDIWTFLHHEDQRWYFRSEMKSTSAYVFDTMGTAHGSFILPGEDAAEAAYLALEAAIDALENGDAGALRSASAVNIAPPAITTPPLQTAIEEMVRLLDEAATNAEGLCANSTAASEWTEASRTARSRVERKSIELRIVASTT